MMYQVGERIYCRPYIKDDTVGISRYYLITNVDSVNNEYTLEPYNYKTNQKEYFTSSDIVGRSTTGKITEARLLDFFQRKVIALTEREILEEIIDTHKKSMAGQQATLDALKGRITKRIEKMQAQIDAMI